MLLNDSLKISDILQMKIVPFSGVFESVDQQFARLIFKKETSTVLIRSKMRHV